MTQKGQVFRSAAGRDKGRLLAAVRSDSAYIYVCDGKERPLANPKRKNPRHLNVCDVCLTESQMRSDRALRKALAVTEADMRTGR
jgi:ribosomal protein L14E/L6E/L27E